MIGFGGMPPPVCGNASPRCRAYVAPGYNPLRLCRECFAKYDALIPISNVAPVEDDGPTFVFDRGD